MRKNSEPIMADIAQMRTIAEEIIKSGTLNLTPGTYTAAQIDRELRKVDNDYFDVTFRNAERLRSEDQTSVDIMYKFFKVSNELGWRIFPGGVVFRLIKDCEKDAGLSKRKVNHFNVPESRRPVAETEITFPPKKTMLKLSKAIRSRNEYGYKYCIISLSDGGLRGRFSNHRYNFAGKKEVVFREPYRIIPTEYKVLDAFENLSFRIDAGLVKNIYGKCKIAIYKDERPTNGSANPYNIRVSFTNTEGWITSSDFPVDFPAAAFDQHFEFEPIEVSNKNTGSPETETQTKSWKENIYNRDDRNIDHHPQPTSDLKKNRSIQKIKIHIRHRQDTGKEHNINTPNLQSKDVPRL